MEIQRQLAEYGRRHVLEIDTMVLWVLHEQFDFGAKRLRQFYDSFAPVICSLLKWYEMDDSDKIWLCTHKLAEYGIDLETWYSERKEEIL